jgi:hypothetical protein
MSARHVDDVSDAGAARKGTGMSSVGRAIRRGSSIGLIRPGLDSNVFQHSVNRPELLLSASSPGSMRAFSSSDIDQYFLTFGYLFKASKSSLPNHQDDQFTIPTALLTASSVTAYFLSTRNRHDLLHDSFQPLERPVYLLRRGYRCTSCYRG